MCKIGDNLLDFANNSIKKDKLIFSIIMIVIGALIGIVLILLVLKIIGKI